MQGIPFDKYEGLGNDFPLFDLHRDASLREAAPVFAQLTGDRRSPLQKDAIDFIRRVCNRHTGVGGDGILLYDFENDGVWMIYYNSDGSRAETCFNGLRCIALHAVRLGDLQRNSRFIIHSDSGDVSAVVGKSEITTSLQGPSFPNSGLTTLKLPSQSLEGLALSLGNPHFVAWSDGMSLESLNTVAREIGGAVEHHPTFPNGVNFEYASKRSAEAVDMAVWERGVGITHACGSGATATVCAGVKLGKLPAGKPVTVKMLGGSLKISVASDFSRVEVTGGARIVFSGELYVKS